MYVYENFCDSFIFSTHDFHISINISLECHAFQGNLVGRGVIELCDGGPPVSAYPSTSKVILPQIR